MGYHLTKDRLKRMWEFTGGFEIINVDNGFFMVKCEQLSDREKLCKKVSEYCLTIIWQLLDGL